MPDALELSTSLTQPLSKIDLGHEMRQSYMAYAMSVIVSRSLPDVRDGLKPVHRRILYSMHENGYTHSKPYRKSARVVGDVIGKYHPHGDVAIYDSLVRMAQEFSLRAPLIDGQGNFGSIDGDSPAAMRYTEARLSKIAESLVEGLDEDTVDFRPNYDESEQEPVVLPAAFPNLLVNGSEGIAVGMATKMPSHNPTEAINATLALINNPGITLAEIMAIMPGPDFPTGGVIEGQGGILQAYETGRGSIRIAGVAEIEEMKNGRSQIVITELPYQVNKEELVKHIASLANIKEKDKDADKRLEGVSDIVDESSSKTGIRVVIELKKDGDPRLVLSKLRRDTNFLISFGINNNCIDGQRRPRVMGVMEILREFVAFRREVIQRRTRFRLEKKRQELVRQIALFAVRGMIDVVVSTIRNSADLATAITALMALEFPYEGELSELLREADPDAPEPTVFTLSEEQARVVAAMRLSSLTTLEQEKTAADARKIMAEMRGLLTILREPEILDDVMRRELLEARAAYPQPRLTRILEAGPGETRREDLVPLKQVVMTLTNSGYVKVTPVDSYREQARGGKGRTGMETKEDDVVIRTLVCSSRSNLTFFTSRGIAHNVKAYDLPEAAPNAKGRPLVNYMALRQNEGETIATVMVMPDPEEASDDTFMMFVTDTGLVRRNSIADFARVNKNGKIAMRLDDENGNPTAKLIDVLVCTQNDDLVLTTRRGKAVRFPIQDDVIRVFKGRDSQGVKGVTLADEDAVVGAAIVKHFEATPQEREAYFSDGTTSWKDDDGTEQTLTLTQERMEEMRSSEQALLTVTSKGFGKRFSLHDFRTTGRGGQGVWVGSFNAQTGDLVGCFLVKEEDGIWMVTDGGQGIRTRVSEVRVMRRVARGVRLFDLPERQQIVDVARIPAEE
jgi:DNA gyrase subunit A